MNRIRADYWQGKSKLDRLVFTITPDASVRFAKIEKNECQVMPFPNPADLPRMKANKDINLMSKAVPMGSISTFSGVPALSIASAYSAERMEAKYHARSATNGASGCARVKRTVWS